MKRLVGAALLFALAAGAALLAGDVRSWEATLERGDAVYAAAPSLARWEAQARLPFGVARGVLGLGDGPGARQALQAYRAAAASSGRYERTPAQTAAVRRAELALVPLARSSDPASASQARTLLGLLVLGGFAQSADQSAIQAAFSDLTDAVRADPGDVTAKYDLELLLRLSALRDIRPAQPVGAGAGAIGKRGGGGGIPGEGY